MKIRKKEEEEEEKEKAPPKIYRNSKVYKDLIWNYNPVQVWERACSPEWSGWLRVFYPQVVEMWNQVLTGMVWLWRKSKFPCCCSHLSFIGSTMKSWSLSSQLRVSVRDCRLLKVVYYYFFIHLWVISSSRARHMNGCAWKLYSVLCFPLWMMFTIYLWKHSNNKTLYIAFQFAVRADKIFLSWAELHTLGEAVGPTWNNKTLLREAGTVEPASETWALHWPQSALCSVPPEYTKAATITTI